MIPYKPTIWAFRERLIETGKDRELWDVLQRRLDLMGLKVKKGTIQDATFIAADPIHARADKARGDGAKTQRNRNGTWTKKGNKSYFGYKLHSKIDIDYELIRDIEKTTASVHDSQVDLSPEGEIVYRDKGYFGATAKGYVATMKRATRCHPLKIHDKLRNKRISRKRAPGERPYALIKNVFKMLLTLQATLDYVVIKTAQTRVTTIARTGVKMTLTPFTFNPHQLRTLKHQRVIYRQLSRKLRKIRKNMWLTREKHQISPSNPNKICHCIWPPRKRGVNQSTFYYAIILIYSYLFFCCDMVVVDVIYYG